MERELYGVYDAIIPSIIKITVHTPPRSSSDFDVAFDYYFIGKSPETVEHFFR